MRPFRFQRARDAADAVGAAASHSRPVAAVESATQFLAGGTTLIDLMKLDVMRPARLVDIKGLTQRHSEIEFKDGELRLGGLALMSDAAAHPGIRREFPVIAQSLELAASPQLRNMATLAGNVLQRTRCPYFRDVSWTSCNKREPGSGCAALNGVNRRHAVLGVSEHCIAAYPGDFAQALIALDASVEVLGASGALTIPFAQLHREPGDTPHVETRLAPGALITALIVPGGPWTRRSLFLKIRDRESYDFALTSAAVALHTEEGNVRQARIAVGGVATVPWRSLDAEAVLLGKPLDRNQAYEAARIAFASAHPREGNRFKVELGKRTLARALLTVSAMEVPNE
jgi:xanthine dehydrogenase YagS FAD-binding subunit